GPLTTLNAAGPQGRRRFGPLALRHSVAGVRARGAGAPESSTMLTTFLRGCSPHTDALKGVPASHLDAGGLADPLDASVDDLAACGGVRPPDDFPRAGTV